MLGLNTHKFDCNWELAQACDQALQEADNVINMQLRAYRDLSAKNTQLQQALDAEAKALHDAKNPPWHQDPMYTGLLGILTGIFLVLSIK